MPSLVVIYRIVTKHTRRSVTILALLAAGAALGQPADAVVDWVRARELHQRVQRGGKLTPEEQAYYDWAREQRGQRPAGNDRGRRRPDAPASVSSKLVPLSDLRTGKYQGFDGGLYGDGSNKPPFAHEAAAMSAAAAVTRLTGAGKPAPDGKIVLLSIGMSNTTQEFEEFKRLADADLEKSPQVIIIDGAQGSQDAVRIAQETAPFWSKVDERLSAAQVTREQVQAIWLKEAIMQPTAAFPAEARKLEGLLGKIVSICKLRYPNLRIIYFSSRTYGGYAQTALNPEPHAYESAFAVRWLIERQMAGELALNLDPERDKVVAPVLLWGPYLWANGAQPRSGDSLTWERGDFGSDGTHPSDTGRMKVARLLLDFFKSETTAAPWFTRAGRVARGPAVPTVANAAYGPDQRHKLDIWAGRSGSPVPVLIFFHGGGFRVGDKADVPMSLVQKCLEAGIAVVSANYRLTDRDSYPAFMLDGARAVQFLRLKAKEWNIDPTRIAACGASAGGGISLWVGYHEDLANPQSSDPVERQSSRLSAMAVINAQTSYALPVIEEVAGLAAAQHPALRGFYGLSQAEFEDKHYTAHTLKEFVEASPISHLGPNDPPAFLYYKEGREAIAPGAKAGAGIHSPKFGTYLKEHADPLGVRVVLRHRDEYGTDPDGKAYAEMVEFLAGVFAKPGTVSDR